MKLGGSPDPMCTCGHRPDDHESNGDCIECVCPLFELDYDR